jgi:hypothetical protein
MLTKDRVSWLRRIEPRHALGIDQDDRLIYPRLRVAKRAEGSLRPGPAILPAELLRFTSPVNNNIARFVVPRHEP